MNFNIRKRGLLNRAAQIKVAAVDKINLPYIYQPQYYHPQNLKDIINQMIKYLAILTLFALAAAYSEENGVLKLAESDFPQVLADHPYLFIKFYTPWCHHCKKIAPIFIELGQALADTNSEIKLAEMDLDEHKAISQKYKVYSYPTLIFFKNGKENRFGGSRTLEFMKFWLGKKVLDPLIPIDSQKLATLESDGRVNIVFYGDLSSPKAEIIAKLASVDDYNMYYQIADSSKPKDSLEIYRPFAKSVQNNIIDANIKNWIALFDRPFVYPFDERASSEIFSDKRNSLFLFTPEGEVGEAVSQALALVAVDWKLHLKRRLIFTEIKPTEEENKGLADYFKINPTRHFLAFVKTAEKLKYLYNGSAEETTKEKIAEFLKNVEGGKVKPFKLDQETRPKSEIKKDEQL